MNHDFFQEICDDEITFYAVYVLAILSCTPSIFMLFHHTHFQESVSSAFVQELPVSYLAR